jgi:hypothetical protein
MSVKVFTQPLPQYLHCECERRARWGEKDLVLAHLSRSRSGLNRRNDLVVPQLRGDNKINPDHRHKADSMLGAAVNSPRLNGSRLAAVSLMACRPFPDAQPGSDNADDLSRIQFLILLIKIHAIDSVRATH